MAASTLSRGLADGARASTASRVDCAVCSKPIRSISSRMRSFDSKWWYRLAGLMPTSSAICRNPVPAYPSVEKSSAETSRIRSREPNLKVLVGSPVTLLVFMTMLR